MEDIAGSRLALRQIVFSVWVILTEHKWVTLAGRRGHHTLEKRSVYRVALAPRGNHLAHYWRTRDQIGGQLIGADPLQVLEKVGARGGNRTRTPVAGKRILSPLRLPVSPPGRHSPV